MAGQRRFLEYSRRSVWLSYFATEAEVTYAKDYPDAKNPRPFPELQEIDVLMRKSIGIDGSSGLGIHVNEEGTTFMQLLHQFTHGGVRSIQALNAGFKVEGIAKVLEQNTRDMRAVGCYVLACNLDWPRQTLQSRLATVQSDAAQEHLLHELYEEFKARAPYRDC